MKIKDFLLSVLMVFFVTHASGQIFKSKPDTTQMDIPEKEVLADQIEKKAVKAQPDSIIDKMIKADPFMGYGKKSAIALNLSSVGIGIEYAYNFNRHLNGRIRANLLVLSGFEQEMELNGTPTIIVADVDVFNTDFLLEYLPFSKSSFKLVAGGSLIINGSGSVNIIYNDVIQYGDLEFSNEEVGDLTIGVDYAGLGFGRAVPKKRVGFGIELGTYYAGSPDVSLAATNMLAPTATEEEAQLQSNLSDYKWFPFINLRLAVRL
jgi:hypothetical protein